MESKIIKKGTKRALGVQQFPFAQDSDEYQPDMDQPKWDALSDSPAVVSEDAAREEEISAPVIDKDRLERESYEKGFRQGEATGREAAEKQLDAVMKRYADSFLEISRIKSTLYEQAEHEVVKLAIEVAKKIVHREIQADRNIIQTLVRVALSHVTEKSPITVRLSPADYQHIMNQHDALDREKGWDISLQSDNSIGQGGCLIETNCGNIDARIEEKFREVENEFFEDLK